MARSRDEYKAEAVEHAEQTLLGQLARYEWLTAGGPARFRQVLEGLWDDGAAIGYPDG
jgi:hypothetical protein